MEDAHVIYAQDTWGFFGVFDGHGGDQCSGFIAKRINEELAKTGMPESDDAVTELVGGPALAFKRVLTGYSLNSVLRVRVCCL